MGENGDVTHKYSIDPAFFNLIGNIENKKIYDIGCGNGYIDRILFSSNAKKIIASDISSRLIDIAKSKSPAEIEYFVSPGSDFSYFSEASYSSFDLIISNMAIHYIADLEALTLGVHKLLKKGGKFVFTVAHPTDDFGLSSTKNINRDEIKEIVIAYSKPFEQEVAWGDLPLAIFKRSISYYINLINEHGFLLQSFVEIPKVKEVNGKVVDTKIPGFMGFCFVKQ